MKIKTVQPQCITQKKYFILTAVLICGRFSYERMHSKVLSTQKLVARGDNRVHSAQQEKSSKSAHVYSRNDLYGCIVSIFSAPFGGRKLTQLGQYWMTIGPIPSLFGLPKKLACS